MYDLSDKPEIEYIDGVGYPKVSPKRKHSVVQAAMVAILSRCAAGGGFAGPEWRVHLNDRTTLVPDVAYVPYDRLRDLPEEQTEEPAFAPDIAVEVRSPSDREAFINLKTQQYLAHGSLLVINADPQTRTMTAHFADGSVRVYCEGERLACETVPWLQFDVAEAFALIDIPPRRA